MKKTITKEQVAFLRNNGLLLAANNRVFHPFGFSLTLAVEEDGSANVFLDTAEDGKWEYDLNVYPHGHLRSKLDTFDSKVEGLVQEL